METPRATPVLTVAAEDPRGEAATRLIAALCTELSERYHRAPSPFTMDEASAPRTAMVIAWLDGEPVGCGALRCIDATTVEIKRMYVVPALRRRGISRRVLVELERLAHGFGYVRIILETGIHNPEALALYPSAGYAPTAAYGRYVGNPEAFCFTKRLCAEGSSGWGT